MYVTARNWGVAPDRFGRMTVGQYLTEFEARRSDGYAGGMTQADIDRLDAMDWGDGEPDAA